MIYLLFGSGIEVLLVIFLALVAHFGWINAKAIYETIVGVFVAYAIFIYDISVSVLSNRFRILSTTKSKIINIIVIRTVPVIGILFLVALDFSTVNISINTLYEILGGITGTWALGMFFYVFRLQKKE
jgi:hypothetical protein